jgi:hypothetical protein
MSEFWLERAAQGPAGPQNESARPLSGVASQASSVSRSNATAAPPSSDGGACRPAPQGVQDRPVRQPERRRGRKDRGSGMKDLWYGEHQLGPLSELRWLGLEPGRKFQLPPGSLTIALALRRYNQRLFVYVLLAPLICASDTPAVLSSANPNYLYLQSDLNVCLSPDSDRIADMFAGPKSAKLGIR